MGILLSKSLKIALELALFENPWGLSAGLGALAWMWLARRGATRTWGVGGLGPFDAAKTDSATFLRFPPSAWLGACGFVFAALAILIASCQVEWPQPTFGKWGL